MPTSALQASLWIEQLLAFGLRSKLVLPEDLVFFRNQLLDLLNISEPYPEKLSLQDMEVPETAEPILEKLLDYACKSGLIPENTLTHRDLFDTRIMGIITPRPSEVIARFNHIKENKGIRQAANYFYHLCQKSNYIRTDRIAKNLKWESASPFGTLEITINLTKPEKDPREIAALKNAPQVGYPKCVLCPENAGYAGRINHPARQNLRTLPLTLHGEVWHFQYSPYVYYNHHCIVLSGNHVPMKISRETFLRLFGFLKEFPHYFIGSNADIPIVGGSILNHDHFQGGYHKLPMEKASLEYNLIYRDDPKVDAGVLHWPLSVIRLRSSDYLPLVDLACRLLTLWREYSDPSADILAYSISPSGEKIPHNSITPIARINAQGQYELDLAFRNNRTSSQHPMGIFHPHSHLHHIKKENIGLIEVMGLFILPGRLEQELEALTDYLTGKRTWPDSDLLRPEHPLAKHVPWLEELLERYGSRMTKNKARHVLQDAVGEKCLQVLLDAGVFKTSPKGRRAFNRFLSAAGLTKE